MVCRCTGDRTDGAVRLVLTYITHLLAAEDGAVRWAVAMMCWMVDSVQVGRSSFAAFFALAVHWSAYSIERRLRDGERRAFGSLPTCVVWWTSHSVRYT